jgi:flagellar hook-length control protein FliK
MTNGLTSPKAAEGPRGPAPDAARGAPPPSDAFAGILGDAQQARTATAEGQSPEKPKAGDDSAAPSAPAVAPAPADAPAPDAATTATAAILAALPVPAAPAAPVTDAAATAAPAVAAAEPTVAAVQVQVPAVAPEPTPAVAVSAVVGQTAPIAVAPEVPAVAPQVPATPTPVAKTDAPAQPVAPQQTAVQAPKPQAQAAASPAPPEPSLQAPAATEQQAATQQQSQEQPLPQPAAPQKPVAQAPQQAAPVAPTAPAAAPAAAERPAPALPTATATPVPLARAAEAVEHVLRVVAARGGVTHARIALHPDSLGSVDVHIRSTAEGLVARVVAHTAEAVQTLQSAANDLRQSLEEQGLNLMSLDIGQPGERRAGDRDHEAAGHGADSDQSSAAGETENAAGQTLRLPTGVLVDVLA